MVAIPPPAGPPAGRGLPPEEDVVPRTARQAIRAWYATHPKTFCPVIGQAICPAQGCENPAIRQDPRCDLALKQAQAAERPAEIDEVRGWIYNLRESPDGRHWLLTFGYHKALLDDFRQLIPARGRRWDPERREWAVAREYHQVLRTLFVNFDRFVSARHQWRKEHPANPATPGD
jgi:hypothetical protein